VIVVQQMGEKKSKPLIGLQRTNGWDSRHQSSGCGWCTATDMVWKTLEPMDHHGANIDQQHEDMDEEAYTFTATNSTLWSPGLE